MTGRARDHTDAGRVTLVDVARHADVSRATASLVLRDSPLVADETRLRVQDSMRQLGYVYHRAAATLRTRRSHTVGLVVPDITNPFYAELTVGVEEQLDEANHVVMLANTAESLDKQERLLAAVHENNADGVLFCPAEGTSRATIDSLRDRHLPVVLLVRYLFDVAIDYVGADNVLGAALAVEHLIAHGHRRIAFIGGPGASSARRDRLRGYRDAMARHGLPVDEALLPTSPSTRDGGHAAIGGLLTLADPPTAALCYNDVVAFGVMLGLQAAGRVVGCDVAVVGFDDIAEAALWYPALTTVSVEPRRIGAEAAGLLLERIAYPDEPSRRIILPPTLAVRASCGAHDNADGPTMRTEHGNGVPETAPNNTENTGASRAARPPLGPQA
jgi:LacI family transcriptional regulator